MNENQRLLEQFSSTLNSLKLPDVSLLRSLEMPVPTRKEQVYLVEAIEEKVDFKAPLTHEDKQELAYMMVEILIKKIKTAEEAKTGKHVLPAGLRWQDIEFIFRDGHEVEINYNGGFERSDYKQMGFQDKKQLKPDTSWELLYETAEKGGEVEMKDEHGRRRKDRKYALSKKLKRFFGIADSPFYPYSKKDGAYRIKMKLVLK